MTSRLICVSNRIALPRKAMAPGGLAIGIRGALRRSGGLWFGWSGELTDTEPGAAQLHASDGVAYACIELPREEFVRYYDGYSNEALWPLMHHMPSRLTFRPQDREAYESINARFAIRLHPLLAPDDLIWVHDYHLIPLGRRLRTLGVRAPIGFFLHTPFPYIETLRVLPNYAELVHDLLCYDVVGFQTAGDLESFLSAVRHLLGAASIGQDGFVRVGERNVCCAVYPIGVDVESIQATASTAYCSEPVRRMIDSLHQRKLVIGVDRLDYSKGLVERFAAYEHFLETCPEHRGRITYLQIAPLSRKDVQSYARIRQRLEQAAGRTNGRFAETDWTPIRYLNRNVPHGTLMGLMRAAQVGLVTPLRDGMNLVAKEYAAAQDPEDPGVLILSTLAGAARELTSALLVNPYDPSALGRALQVALAMPQAERRDRHAEMLHALEKRSIDAWVDGFVSALHGTHEGRRRPRTKDSAGAMMPEQLSSRPPRRRS